jgi:hypothetical protein
MALSSVRMKKSRITVEAQYPTVAIATMAGAQPRNVLDI